VCRAEQNPDEVTGIDQGQHAGAVIGLLRACPEENKWPVVLKLLADASPLVRSSAASALGDQLTAEHVQALVRACGDEPGASD
jgi:hypothetical protein